MLKNYLKTTFRKLIKDKVYSLIKIIGLAISIATSLLIFLWINDELNYDSYHKDVSRIFRVAEEIKNKSGRNYSPIIPLITFSLMKIMTGNTNLKKKLEK